MRLKNDFPADMSLKLFFDLEKLKQAFQTMSPHALLMHMEEPGPQQFSALRNLLNTPGVPAIIVLSEYLSAPQAVCCIKTGAVDCLPGPYGTDVIGKCIRAHLPQETDNPRKERNLIAGSSSVTQRLRDTLHRYAPEDLPVLITGETGSGKELAARTIHMKSSRKDCPFVPINCAGYPPDVLGSELFGTVSGAFTGSVDRPGFFETANGGTLFLDEIGELSIQGQASLLRVLEEGCIRRFGSVKQKGIDVRIIAATNRSLKDSVQNGEFRADLFYRLSLLPVHMPPLRKRQTDIPVLAADYLKKIRPREHWHLNGQAFSKLMKHSWPGNVRELHSVLIRAVLTATGHVIRGKDILFH